MAEDPAKKSYLFGRQKSKKLSPRQQGLVDELLPKLQIDPGSFQQQQLFDQPEAPLWLEIGFGGGEHLAAMAAAHPDVNFIGCEPFINGIAKLLTAIEEQGLQNIRIYNNDARHVLNVLAPASLERVFLLYPDPWPKKRHHKRRFVTGDSLALLASAMKPGASLLIASDIADYIRTSLLALQASADFTWSPDATVDWQTPPPGWPGTRYEAKAIREGRTPTYLKVKRN